MNIITNKIAQITKTFLVIILGVLFFGISHADFDLEITDISLSNEGTTVSLFSHPSIDITIKNNNGVGLDIAQNISPIPEGFITCIELSSQNNIFKSSSMGTFIINPGSTMIAGNLKLKDTLTQTERTVDIQCFINKNGQFNGSFNGNDTPITNNSKLFSFNVNKLGRFDTSINKSIDSIREHLDAAEPNSTLGGGDSIRSFIFNKIINVITPIIIIVGIIIGIIGGYRLLFSNSEDETKKGTQLVVYGILGIIIILSSRYIGTIIFENMFQYGDAIGLNGVELAMTIYNKIAYPFIKIVIYLVLGILFLMLAGKAFTFITNTDGAAQKKAGTMIGRSAISMLIIIGAKQIVEAIYGKQTEVMNTNAQNLGDIGSGILADKSIPILYNVINWVMGLTSLIVLIIILVQTFEILVNPDKADNRQKIGKSIIYIFIGILIIGAGYLITNFLIIN